MNFIVCIDDNKGITFNNRRVSKDKTIILDIKSNISNLAMNAYSYKMFETYQLNDNIILSEDIINDDTYYFIEDSRINNTPIDNLIIYNFNKDYPSVLKLDINLSLYKLIKEETLVGTSHETITKTIYMKEKI